MNRLIYSYLSAITFGTMMEYENLALLPLYIKSKKGPEYMVLQEALERDCIAVTEVSEKGSVPELKVVNTADSLVLILEGEELTGARQNRVLNASVLVGKQQETRLPVCCVEEGRWAYVSRRFSVSDTFMPVNIRAVKNRSVDRSLKGSGRFYADQEMMWDCVDGLAMETSVRSGTSAMNDIFDARRDSLEEYLAELTLAGGQKGMLAFINGEIAGLDILSSEDAFRRVYYRLLRGYAMRAFVGRKDERRQPCAGADEEFIGRIARSGEERYRSPGRGWDYRYSGEGVVGSVLVYRQQVVHAAFFAVENG